MDSHNRINMDLVRQLCIPAICALVLLDSCSFVASSILIEGKRSSVIGSKVVLSCTYLLADITDFGSVSWSLTSTAHPTGQLLLKYPCEAASLGCGDVLVRETQSPLAPSASPTVGRESRHALLVEVNEDHVVANLTISDLQLSDEGNYTCGFATYYGPINRGIFLSVNSYPEALVIEDLMRNESSDNGTVIAVEGELRYLTCSTDRPVKPEVPLVWSVDGHAGVTETSQDGTTTGNDNILKVSSTELSFRPTRDDDGKTLVCRTAAGDSALSTSVVLKVRVCVSVVSLGGCAPGMVGTALNLTCSSDGPPEESSLHLYGDGRAVIRNNTATQRVTSGGVERDALVYDVVLSPSDQGSGITCCVTGDAFCSEQCSDTCHLEVLNAPSVPVITSNTVDEPVVEGVEGVRWTCTADGHPRPPGFLQWTKDGYLETNFTQPSVNPSSLALEFPVVRRVDAGVYACVAKNDYGSKARRKELVVQFSPSITSEEEQLISIDEGEQLTISCTAEANPAPTINWIGTNNDSITWGITTQTEVYGDVFKKTVNSALTILSVVASRDFGTVKCVATNDFGETTTDVHITGRGRPQPPKMVTASAAEQPGSLIITWTRGDDGGAAQTVVVTYCLYPAGLPCKDVVGIEDDQLILAGLQIGTWYSVAVAAENRFGRSDTSDTVVVSTKVAPGDQGIASPAVVGMIGGGLGLIAIVIAVIIWKVNRKQHKRRHAGGFASSSSSTKRILPDIPKDFNTSSCSPPHINKQTELEDPTYTDINDLLSSVHMPVESAYTPMNRVGCSVEPPVVMKCDGIEYTDETYVGQTKGPGEVVYSHALPRKRDAEEEPRYVNKFS